MDTTKQHPLPGAQESDDLIAELARLVAQDARSQSVNSAAYSRPDPEPQFFEETHSDPEPLFQEDAQAEAATPEPAQSYEDEQRAEPESEFDFGFAAEYGGDRGSTEPRQEDPEHDPIADLIANAEGDNTASDKERREDDDFFATQSVHAQPDYWPTSEAQAHEPEFVAGEPEAPQMDDAYLSAQYSDASADRDPLREIEALIGEAARVNTDVGVNPERKVRSSFLETADYQDIKADRAVDAAESAILAAAAASGARVSHAPPMDAPQPEPDVTPAFSEADAREDYFEEYAAPDYPAAEMVEPAQRSWRRSGFLLPAVAGTVIVAALAGGYFLFLAPSPVPADAPVLTAEAGELKEVPETTATPTTASESVIFNEIDGNTVPLENEALVSRDQTNGATGAAVGSVIAPEEGEATLANRPVRTVTVRPDGTIVSSDNSIAGSNVLPVERPDVPAVPNSTLTADPIGEAIAAAIAEEGSQQTTAEPAMTVASADAAEPATSATSEGAAIIDPATIPRPVPRPAGLTVPQATQPIQQPVQQPVQPTQTQIATATAQTALPQTPVETPAVATGNIGAWVQLSSQRSEEAARAGIPDLQSRFGSLFNGAALDVSRVDLGDRGVYYRVRLPQPTMSDANSVCDAIKGQGGDCFVLNN
jgi:hypothetical protein